MKRTILGLVLVVGLGGCGGDDTALLPVDEQVQVIDERPAAAVPVDPDPPVNWCVRGAFEFGEWACPDHPGCAMCRVQIPGGQDGMGTVPNGCIAPSGAHCIDFCEYCPEPDRS